MSCDQKPDEARVDADLAAAFSELVEAFARTGAPPEIVDLARRLDQAIARVNVASEAEQGPGDDAPRS